MSDMRKWMQLLSEDSIEKGSAVKLSDDYGGGIGTFEQLSEENPELAVINMKGNVQEIPLLSLQKVLAAPTEYGDDPCYNITPNQYAPGASVRVKNLYGGGTGDGYGVFVAYATDGATAIINVDSEDRTIPVDLVYPADEQQAKDDFQSTGGDGSQSPMTCAGDNVQDKGMTNMSNMERWMDAVSDKQQKESTYEMKEEPSSECGCDQYDCTTCFPLSEDEINYSADCDYEDEEPLHELDLENSDYFDDEDESMPGDDAMADAGDDELAAMDRRPEPESEPFIYDSSGNASVDVSDMLGKIDYIQNMGMSMTDKHFDIDQLMNMRPAAIQRIYAKVSGEGLDEALGSAEGDRGEWPADMRQSDNASDQSIMLGDTNDRSSYGLVEPGDAIMFKGHTLTYRGYQSGNSEKVVVELNGKQHVLPASSIIASAVPAEMTETSAGGIGVAAGLGKVIDDSGIYEAASIDAGEVKSLEKMDINGAKAKATEIIQGSRTSDARKMKLISNVQRSRTVTQVLQLMYNLLLAGDGMSTVGSKWQSKYNEAVEIHENTNRKFDTVVRLKNGTELDNATIEYDYDSADPGDRMNPSHPATASIYSITYNGKDIDVDLVANLDEIEEVALEHEAESVQNDNDEYGDYMYNRQREERYNMNDSQYNEDISRLRELAGMSPSSDPEFMAGMSPDDGMQTGGTSMEDFKELFWDYWDRSSPSSQHQYLRAVFGDEAALEDFSDAAAQAIEHIVSDGDASMTDKQLHLLRRIGMPLFSVDQSTGMFHPS